MKKPWEKPKLIVLARGKPEEAVLWFCKLLFSPSQGENGYFHACAYFVQPEPGEPPPPDPCSAWTTS
jgi:hypothetical protein